MAEVPPGGGRAGGIGGLLTSKWGPAPVWVYALGVLVIAWIYSKYRTMKAAAAAGSDQPTTADATGDYAAEGQDVAPQFIIMNNLPGQVITPGPNPANTPSHPVKNGSPITIPITPPGTTTKPPTSSSPGGSVKGKITHMVSYTVQPGDTLDKIAAKYKNPINGKPLTWRDIWNTNTKPGARSAATIAVIEKHGPKKILPGETFLIPQ